MIDFLKDRYRLGLVLASLFFLGILFSIYSVYSLPSDLALTSGYQSVFTKVYVVLTLTFLTGAIAIWNALQNRNDVIVFRERKIENVAETSESRDSKQMTINLDIVRNALKQNGDAKENLQAALHSVCRQLDAGQGAIYVTRTDGNVRIAELKSGYALNLGESTVLSYEFGEGLVGQVAAGQKTIYADEVPDGYIKILSGLGSASPRYLLIVPLLDGEQTAGVLEIASFTPIVEEQRKFVEESAQIIAQHISGK